MRTHGRPPVQIVQYVDAPYPSNVSEVMSLDDPGNGTTNSVCFRHKGTDHYDIQFPASPDAAHNLNTGCPGDWFTRNGNTVTVTSERPDIAPFGRRATGWRAWREDLLGDINYRSLMAFQRSAAKRGDLHELEHIAVLLIVGDTGHGLAGGVCMVPHVRAHAAKPRLCWRDTLVPQGGDRLSQGGCASPFISPKLPRMSGPYSALARVSGWRST